MNYTDARMRILVGLVFAGLLLVTGRLFHVQILKGPALRTVADRAKTGEANALPYRGEIQDHSGDVLAISVPSISLYAHPHRLDEAQREQVCEALTTAGLEDRCAVLRSGRRFAWLARKLPKEENRILLESVAGIAGIGWNENSVRTYPKGSLAGQLIGFVGVDGDGLEGTEKSLNPYLRPLPRKAQVIRDARRRFLLTPEDVERVMPRKRNVELTIDTSLQALVEEALNRALEDFGGKAAVALVAHVESGAIRAAAVAPKFDPNRFREYGPADWRPRFTTDAFEPGSTVKPLVLAAALMANQSLSEIVYAEQGKFQVDEHTISDDEPMGWLSLRNVVVKSSNIGAAKIGFLIGKDVLDEAYRKLGFGRPVGVKMPSETRGILRPHTRWSQLDWAALSFGQGLSVSPLQLLRAYLVLAGDGRLVEPHFVSRVYEAETGRTVWAPERKREVVLPDREVARQVRSVLAAVVEEGTGQRAKVPGLRVGGKTGTAQKPDLEAGGYREGSYIAWFCGLFPVDDPQWAAVVLVDEPQQNIYGGAVAAPVFREIAEVIAVREGLLDAAGKIRDVAYHLPTASYSTPSHAGSDERVPDLRGLSLRDAGRLAADFGAQVAPRGYGAVRAQNPEPGTPVKKEAVWHLDLGDVEGT